MNQKHIGILLMIVAVLIAGFTYTAKARETAYINQITLEEGSCFLEDGTCLHEQSLPWYVLGWAIAGVLFLFGSYLTFFDKTQEVLTKHQVIVSQALESAKKQEREKDEFKAYLAGFNAEEQKVLQAVKDQEGIKQSTLRYKTGLSKTGLSLILQSLEERDIISRKESGKTKEVFVRKKF
jgi:uncharacterized membrane protein